MMEKKKKSYINTTVDDDLLRSLKILAVREGMRINNMLEEAIRDLLKKYAKKSKQ